VSRPVANPPHSVQSLSPARDPWRHSLCSACHRIGVQHAPRIVFGFLGANHDLRQSFVRQESKVCRPRPLLPRRQWLTGTSYNVTPEELFDLFGKYGPIRYALLRASLPFARGLADSRYRQVRQGIANNTKGTAFVVYEDVMDAKSACDKLNGYNFQNRYLVGRSPSFSRPSAGLPLLTRPVVLYHQPDKMAKTKEDLEARKENLERIKKQHGID